MAQTTLRQKVDANRRTLPGPAPAGEHCVFLNVPYDRGFRDLYLAYITGITAFGLVPRAGLEIAAGKQRLERIIALIQHCRYSIHDLSRVELDRTPPATPRFNMPFELGLAVAHSTHKGQQWFVCEAKHDRLKKSLSDMLFTDAHVHDNTVPGVFEMLCGIFKRHDRQPAPQLMLSSYLVLRRNLGRIVRAAGAPDPYAPRAFQDLVLAAKIEHARRDGTLNLTGRNGGTKSS